MQDPDTQETLAAQLRQVLTDPGPRAAEAVQALDVLLDLGWVDPDRVQDLLGGRPAVRSLAEDLAVARTRAGTAGVRAHDLRRRTEAALARSAELRSEDQARSRPSGAAQDRVAALQQEVDQLRHALESRPRIEHAVGIVMQLVGCDEDVAWDLLSRFSQHTNVKVRVVAEALVARVGSGRGVSPDVGKALRELAREKWTGTL
ncbi:ANTAR domain-containing protein [Kineococcus sp. NPDC059986]|uniref:ANTAR domain-containing protein n=1 Tax=Kineococcus sp. NPDC059986 TaxID=3155538 RepID=UPI00344CDCB2